MAPETLRPKPQRGGAGAAQDGRDASQYKLWRTLVYTRRAAWPRPPARSAHTSLEPIGAIVQDEVGPRRRALAASRAWRSSASAERAGCALVPVLRFAARRLQFWAATQ